MTLNMTLNKTKGKVHILGIGGTFMGGLALLARELGWEVTGSDQHIYPPMSTQLEQMGIKLYEGYDPVVIQEIKPDCIIIGNAMSRGNPVVEYILNEQLPYVSGPQWLLEQVLQKRWVLAVSGTHGKTTTSSMLAWVLEYAGYQPGFLIGGIPENFGVSARLGETDFFVVEADEYDSAFFDKRSKFVHYHPKTLIINNIEFDHADIFENLEAILKQFHHLVRTVPSMGKIIYPAEDKNAAQVIQKGLWSNSTTFGESGEWQVKTLSPEGSSFEIYYQGKLMGQTSWELLGQHNVLNALACIAAAHDVGVPPHISLEALSLFKSVKRRLELKAEVRGIKIYDDFAHHPTAIQLTLQGLRAKVGKQKIHVCIDLRSNTMKMGIHQDKLAASFEGADSVSIYKTPDIQWPVETVINHIQKNLNIPAKIYTNTNNLIQELNQTVGSDEHILIMSNGGFEGIHDKLVDKLRLK
jgi:UDP-N-acetylmuramate: L-alanyl-gamma-D-glutamyl-meso-diaminopimelate ligase